MGRTVLVVDDAVFMRRLMRDILRGDGYSVWEAVNGRDALEKFAEIHPDVVTMDVSMPEMDGLTAVRAIRDRFPLACVIVVSALTHAEARSEALAAGATDFIGKPFPPEALLTCVRACVTGSAC